MPDPQGLVAFAGVQQPLAANVTLAHGIRPSRSTLDIAPQTTLPSQQGTLTLSYATTRVQLSDCRLESLTTIPTEQGDLWRLILLDRRWRWAYGCLSGHYNVRRRDGLLQSDTQRNPRELAALCLQAMGETRFDISQLPGQPRPQVRWNHEVPAVALQRLAALYGCQVTLRLDNSVAIVRPSSGNFLPTGPHLQSDQTLIEVPELPAELAVHTAPLRDQLDFTLAAVGLDRNGEVLPLAQLSYRPDPKADDGGWARLGDLPSFNNLLDVQARRLARESVYRWYRIVGRQGEAASLTASAEPKLLSQLAKIHLVQLDPLRALAQETPLPAQVWGIWHDWQRDHLLDNSAEQLTPLPIGQIGSRRHERELLEHFTFDRQRGIVRFAEPVVQLVKQMTDDLPSYEIHPATLVLRAAVEWRREPDGPLEQLRVSRRLRPGPPEREAMCVTRDDLIPQRVTHYDANYRQSRQVSNFAQIEQSCQDELHALEAVYAAQAQQGRVYVGLVPLEVDGTIRIVRWMVGPQGCRTLAAANCDQLPSLSS